jgi:hypothetical protein
VYKIDPRYGTNEDYANECRNAQTKMKSMDYVTNHWGIEHWMIKIYQHTMDSSI